MHERSCKLISWKHFSLLRSCFQAYPLFSSYKLRKVLYSFGRFLHRHSEGTSLPTWEHPFPSKQPPSRANQWSIVDISLLVWSPTGPQSCALAVRRCRHKLSRQDTGRPFLPLNPGRMAFLFFLWNYIVTTDYLIFSMSQYYALIKDPKILNRKALSPLK